MSKVSMPRPRYLAVVVDAARPVSRRAFQAALTARARLEGWPEPPHLTRYAFPHAIVRVDHTLQGAARLLLPRIDWVEEGGRLPVTVRTTMASGTLRALTAKTRQLAQPPRRFQGSREAGGAPQGGPTAARAPRPPGTPPGRAPD